MLAMPTNRLAGETSPYLLQHAHNPVDWYPWGPEALGRARTEDRPIFLSIGYAACHWCHVMERESFESPTTAARLNSGFVAIKVDREERPDLDSIYMTAVQAMTGQGGWPMSVFLTPDGRPFYGGTYFPAARGMGIPAFADVLDAVAAAWHDRRGELEEMGRRLADAIARSTDPPAAGPDQAAPAPDLAAGPDQAAPAPDLAAGPDQAAPAPDLAAGPDQAAFAPSATETHEVPSAPATGTPEVPSASVAAESRPIPAPPAGIVAVPPAPVGTVDVLGLHAHHQVGVRTLDRATAALISAFDRVNGGWGSAPKFPQPAIVEFLLARAATHHEPEPLAVAERALQAMAAGGIHDQVGGGFHRYSTDARWLVPHFEKMLYDNAQLARAYVQAFQLTGEQRHARVAERTLDYLRREMATPDGLFAASQDADTDGVEGATYTWTLPEIEDVLGSGAALAADAFGATAPGNWEGRNVLHRPIDEEILARRHGLPVDEVAGRLDRAADRLRSARDARPQPARDTKGLAAWNGLAIAAFADASVALGRADYLATATCTAAAALLRLRDPNGRVRRSWKDGRATPAGFLDDHALLADGLLALYEATFDERWFGAARDLADAVLTHFADSAGGFWDTADDHEPLIARPRQVEDNAVPSGGAAAARVLLRLAALTGEARYRAAALGALPAILPLAERYPTGFAAWLAAIDLASAPLAEVAIVGEREDPAAKVLLEVATRGLHPHRIVAMTDDPQHSRVELLQSRFALRGRPTAFVCRDFACRQPVTEPEALAAQLVG